MQHTICYSKRGATIVEIAIALAILVILAVVGTLALRKVLEFEKLESATQELVVKLRDAQQRAITQEDGTAWGIRFYHDVMSGQDSYKLVQVTPGAETVIWTYSLEQLEFAPLPPTPLLTFERISGEANLTVGQLFTVTIQWPGANCGTTPDRCMTVEVTPTGIISSRRG